MIDKTIFSLGSTCLDIAIRAWTKDKQSYVVDTIFDVKKLADKLGCTFLGEQNLKQNINEFTTEFTEQLYGSPLLDGIKDERKVVIIQQLIEDINTNIKIDKNTISLILGDEDLKRMIEENSVVKIKEWSEKEKGIYNNCLRFSVDAIVKFIQLLPEYSQEALKILYQKNNKTFKEIGEQLRIIIEMLNSQKSVSDEYRDFEIDYLRKIEKKYKKIVVFGAGLLRRNVCRYNINTSYIELSCMEDDKNFIERTVSASNIFDKNSVVWLTGEAGGGKTTFVQWLAVNIAIGNLENFKGFIPIVIQLRTVSKFPICIEKEIGSILGVECPKEWVSYLIKYDKVLLLFDGVDELSVYNRNDFYSLIEDIVDEFKENKCKKSKIIITSRPYVEDTLNTVKHSRYRILRMNSKNIDKFVRYWHKTIFDETETEEEEIELRSEKLIDVINSTPAIKNIASTPLLCAMICALNYVNNESIPSNKNELYEKCCHMLIEDRDKERHISVAENEELNRLDYTKKSRFLQKIAIYMMNNEVVECKKDKIVKVVKDMISKSTILESSDLREHPSKLVNHLIQRTGILREPSVGKIDFIHKTFLEYLAAESLYRENDDQFLIDRSIEPFWKEAVIMSFNQMDQRQSTRLLEKYLELYHITKCADYIFMAGLCAQNACDTERTVRNKIYSEIQNLIPPNLNHIEQLAEAGEYILPFLKDKKEYTETERKNCLVLLDHILYEEQSQYIGGLQILISYLNGNGDFLCKDKAAKMISEYPEDVIEENGIRKKVSYAISDTMIQDEECILSMEMFCLMGVLPEVKKFNNIVDLKIVNTRDSYDEEMCHEFDKNILSYFTNVKRLTLSYINEIEIFQLLNVTKGLDSMTLTVKGNNIQILDEINGKDVCKNIKNLKIEFEDISFICQKDLESFVNLESLSLIFHNSLLEFEINQWDKWKKLLKVNIIVPEFVYYELEPQKDNWKTENPQIDFSITYE